MSEVTTQSSGVVDPLAVVEVVAPDGSVLWLDQASGELYQSLLQPPLSGDELPDYVTLSPEAGVAVVHDAARPLLTRELVERCEHS